MPLVRQAKLGVSRGVKCLRGNYVSDRVRANHPPIPSVATARKVVQEVRTEPNEAVEAYTGNHIGPRVTCGYAETAIPEVLI